MVEDARGAGEEQVAKAVCAGKHLMESTIRVAVTIVATSIMAAYIKTK